MSFSRDITAFILVLLGLLTGCGGGRTPDSEITVAAASNLTGVFDEISAAFTRRTRTKVTISYASTAQLAQQIENGAPFDVFAAADVEHIDGLIHTGKAIAGTRVIYAQGVLALWSPRGTVSRLEDLSRPDVRVIAIASPNVAPYGKAAVEVLKNAGLWNRVEPRVVYSTNINMARQFAASGNADAAFTALSLVLHESGRVIRIHQSLYSRINQAAAVVTASAKQSSAKSFLTFLMSAEGRGLLERFGYNIPRS